MARRKTAPNMESFGAIPQDQRKEWEDFIKRSRSVVKAETNAKFKLIILAAELNTKYGEQTLRRWAEEIGIGYDSAKKYRMLATRGVDEVFLKRYSELSYSTIRDIVFHNGGVNNRSEYFLDYALEHKLGVTAMNAYMRDTAAPPMHKEEAKAALMAIRAKQDVEGFSDSLRTIMEHVVEDHPELEKTIMDHRIVKASDLDQILVQAGIKSNDEQRLVDWSKRQIDRVRKDMLYYRDNGSELIESIEHNHESSQELYDKLKYLRDYLNDILDHQPEQSRIQSKDEVVVELRQRRSAV